MVIRKHFFFSGRVQGVGFRWHAQYAASTYGISGWVANLFDGRVEMEVQGETTAIAMMLKTLYKARFVCIDNIEEENIPLEEGDRGFYVKN